MQASIWVVECLISEAGTKVNTPTTSQIALKELEEENQFPKLEEENQTPKQISS